MGHRRDRADVPSAGRGAARLCRQSLRHHSPAPRAHAGPPDPRDAADARYPQRGTTCARIRTHRPGDAPRPDSGRGRHAPGSACRRAAIARLPAPHGAGTARAARGRDRAHQCTPRRARGAGPASPGARTPGRVPRASRGNRRKRERCRRSGTPVPAQGAPALPVRTAGPAPQGGTGRSAPCPGPRVRLTRAETSPRWPAPHVAGLRCRLRRRAAGRSRRRRSRHGVHAPDRRGIPPAERAGSTLLQPAALGAALPQSSLDHRRQPAGLAWPDRNPAPVPAAARPHRHRRHGAGRPGCHIGGDQRDRLRSVRRAGQAGGD